MNTGKQKGLDQEVRVLGSRSSFSLCVFSKVVLVLGRGLTPHELIPPWFLLDGMTKEMVRKCFNALYK